MKPRRALLPTLLLLAGCATPPPATDSVGASSGTVKPADGHLAVVDLRKPADRAEIVSAGNSTVVVITSPSGIGAVTLSGLAAVRPHPLTLRFQYAPGQPFRYLEGVHVRVDGAREVEVPAAAARKTAEYVEMILPSALFPAPGDQLEIQWVDAYR